MHTGYVGVTTQQMLDHLYENYSVITAVDIEYNNTQNERAIQSNLSDWNIVLLERDSGRICCYRQAALSNRPSR